MLLESNNLPQSVADKIFDGYKQREEKPRSHLGPSQLGHDCDRWLWLSFRWAVKSDFDGRMLKLFRRGHMEEIIVVNDLLSIGVDVRETGDEQRRVKFAPHISGSIDGIIYGGLQFAPKSEACLEVKTWNHKNFEKLLKDGLVKTKPEHIVQMNCYMMGAKKDRTLYVAICKDDDRIFVDWIHYDKDIAERAIERGIRIVNAPSMPEPMMGASPVWYKCQYCDAHDFCHKTKAIKPDCVNCRTCAHSTPIDGDKWKCELHNVEIPTEDSRNAFDCHVIHPDLVPWKVDAEKSTVTTAAYVIDGKIVFNGTDGEKSVNLLTGGTVGKLCSVFNGTVQK